MAVPYWYIRMTALMHQRPFPFLCIVRKVLVWMVAAVVASAAMTARNGRFRFCVYFWMSVMNDFCGAELLLLLLLVVMMAMARIRIFYSFFFLAFDNLGLFVFVIASKDKLGSPPTLLGLRVWVMIMMKGFMFRVLTSMS